MDSIQLKKACENDSGQIHEMQIEGFRALLEKYRDYETSPGAETLERVKRRFSFNNVDQFFIRLADENIGYIRIQRLDEGVYRLSQMFILPVYQGRGFAQAAVKQAEALYPQAEKWVLDTIKQEQKLCHLYEKLGYKLTGAENNIKDGMDLVDYEK